MSVIVPRTVTVVNGRGGRSEPLVDFRSASAYVLLGDPGAGKTEALRLEHAAHADSEFLTARRFGRMSHHSLADMKGKTLFIDGLDEARAGSRDPRRPLDRLLAQLDHLGNPALRLSCRAADWLGRNDLQEIVAEAGYDDTLVLHLDPLTGNDIRRMLADLGVSDVRVFLAQARERDLDGLLDNPQLLKLLAKATRDGEWPKDRLGIFELACRKLAREWNAQHRAVQQSSPPISANRITSAAGHLSALLLLSDRCRVSLNGREDAESLHLEDIGDGDRHALLRAVKSNLFEGRPDGGLVSVHRQISEFLAARFLGGRIEAGVPAGRVLALMTGHDGGLVTEMRGLSAWLAAFDGVARRSLIERDPIGVALYGDVSRFRGDELEHLLRAFANEGDEVRPWNWPPATLASLVNPHSVAVLERYLGHDDRTDGCQTVAGLLLHALSRTREADVCPAILDRAVRDATWNSWIRESALRTLLHQSGDDTTEKWLALLDDLRGGRVEDRSGELLGTLLNHLYPAHVGPDRIWDYLVARGLSGPGGAFRLFWSTHLPNRTKGDDLAILLRSLADRRETLRKQLMDDRVQRVVQKLVRDALVATGDGMPTATLYDWLELIEFDEMGPTPGPNEHRAIGEWISERTHLQKELALEGRRRVKGQRESQARQSLMQVRERRSEYRAKRHREQEELITYTRKHVRELSEGRCPPGLLHHIGEAYHDVFLDSSAATPRLRVLKLLQGHADLADAAMQGFRRVCDRKDLPTLREVIRLNEQKRISVHALPVLAGFDLMSPGSLDARGSGEIARAAALYYLMPLNVEGHPPWYRWALKRHPEAVAEALIKVTRSRVRRRRDCLYLWDLPRDDAHRAVARLAAVPLLRAFPTRCTEPQVDALHAILLAALRWEAEGLGEFVEARVSKAGLDVAQRALWLAAGLLLSPEANVPRLATFLEEGEEARSRQVVRLLAPTDMGRLPMRWQARELRTMIELLGSRYSPWRPEGFGMASHVEEDRWRVEGLISSWATTLASRTDRDASEALNVLCASPALDPWHFILKRKRDEQTIARRDATFAVPDLSAVQYTLANAEPANPADMAALVADRLQRLGEEIARGNTDDWQQYWNEDPRTRRPTGPKHEETCRDALLSDLRRLLPDGVDAQPEAHHARDNRADIRISFNGHAIPVEIKKDSHPRLWSAVTDQLASKYAVARESAGFGIYLVLWFGRGKMPVPPTGRRPETPKELRERLQGQLTGPHRHRIQVVVIDVSGSSPD